MLSTAENLVWHTAPIEFVARKGDKKQLTTGGTVSDDRSPFSTGKHGEGSEIGVSAAYLTLLAFAAPAIADMKIDGIAKITLAERIPVTGKLIDLKERSPIMSLDSLFVLDLIRISVTLENLTIDEVPRGLLQARPTRPLRNPGNNSV